MQWEQLAEVYFFLFHVPSSSRGEIRLLVFGRVLQLPHASSAEQRFLIEKKGNYEKNILLYIPHLTGDEDNFSLAIGMCVLNLH